MKFARLVVFTISLAAGVASALFITRAKGPASAAEPVTPQHAAKTADALMEAYVFDTRMPVVNASSQWQPWPKAKIVRDTTRANAEPNDGDRSVGRGEPAPDAATALGQSVQEANSGTPSPVPSNNFRAMALNVEGRLDSSGDSLVLPTDRLDARRTLREYEANYKQSTDIDLNEAIQIARTPPLPQSVSGSNFGQPDPVVVRHINMGVGNAVMVDLPRDAAEVLVAGPKIADAVVRSSRRIYVIAKSAGQTTIDALDLRDRRIASIQISIGETNVSDLGHILKLTIPTGNIVVRAVSGAIILTGEVDSTEDAQKAVDIAKAFTSPNAGSDRSSGTDDDQSQSYGKSGANVGGKTSSEFRSIINFAPTIPKDGTVINSLTIRGRNQVMLKVTVAEVQRQVMKQLGITSSMASGNWGTFSQQNGLPLNLQTLTTGAATFGRGSLQATLTAFERDGVARVLAEPTVTAVSGESAKFTAGGKIPVPQSETCPPAGTAGQCIINLTYENYGVSLNFTPTVLSAGDILLHVSTEVTEIDPQNNFQLQGLNVPGFRTRTNETTVELPSGGSIVSAGLLQVQSEQVINGLPGLMNLPILGQLFRSRDYQRQETELMIIVTPYVAKPVTASQVPLPTDGFADASDPQTALLGRINRTYATRANPDVLKNFQGRFGFIND